MHLLLNLCLLAAILLIHLLAVPGVRILQNIDLYLTVRPAMVRLT